MDSLDLISKKNNDRISIKINEKKWCELFFIQNEKKQLLGCNNIKRVIKPLAIAFLPSKSRKTQLFAGKNLFEILYLSEPHSMLLGEEDNNSLKLYQVDSKGELHYLLFLDEETKLSWLTNVFESFIK